MLNPIEARSPSGNKPPLAQWLAQTLEQRGRRVKFQLRGNNLHLLCEGLPCPEQAIVLRRLIPALKRTDINTLNSAEQPPIYQVLVYGRAFDQERPSWTAPIHLNQLDRYLKDLSPHLDKQLEHAAAAVGQGTPHAKATAAGREGGSEGTALILSNRSLARRGDPEGVARYLSETLSALGVAVRVTVKTIPYPAEASQRSPESVPITATHATAPRRLWITCEANYSPDPVFVGEPIAQKLRDLELEGFRDAVILIQVTGEPKPDWMLRVDLTPIKEMLREWARWGDVGAISRLLQQALIDRGIRLDTTTLKEATLHLCFSLAFEPSRTGSETGVAPNQQAVKEVVAPLLDLLGPQGIHAAMLYGQVRGQDDPVWVEWINLPANQHPALADAALTLAQQGDWGAIAFLLNRLLNPDLDKQLLATGGVRLQLLPRQDLLHVMTDAPVCPDQRQVSQATTKFLQQLNLPGFTGVRVYGRRAGQKRPLWSYGLDFTPRERLVPEATPEFAATDAYIGDLIARPHDQIMRPDLTPEDLQSAWAKMRQQVSQGIQQTLIRSQFFAALPETPGMAATAARSVSYREVGTALVWGAAGLLLMVQVDWAMGRFLQASHAATPEVAVAPTPGASPMPLSDLSLQRSTEDDPDVFDTTGFTAGDDAINLNPSGSIINPSVTTPDFTDPDRRGDLSSPGGSLPASPPAPILTVQSPYPTFNSRQLDEKIALYEERVAQEGVPDVLIIGSSRALRGVDPAALHRALAELGYVNVSVFNFGVNGATAQVVNLIVQQLIKPDQLPQLIIWADGARAFNSGAVDVTYNGIVVSEGYRQLTDGTLPPPIDVPSDGTATELPAQASRGIGASLAASYQSIDRWLSQRLAAVSTAYEGRDRLKSLLQQQATAVLPQQPAPQAVPVTNGTGGTNEESSSLASQGQGMIDFDGFLPLSLQFNPATYYQQYARVAGAYDSDYESFQIEGKQAIALESLLQFTHSRNIPVVFVNLPLTQEYLDPVRLEYEQEFKQYMLGVAVNNQGLVFRDLGQIWLTDYDYFSDPSHLNRYGAYEVSYQLAQDAMIPWFQSPASVSPAPTSPAPTSPVTLPPAPDSNAVPEF
jgi:hypothetical protein